MQENYTFSFNNNDGLNDDIIDQTQRNAQNTRFTNLNITNYFSKNVSKDHVDFVSKTPGLAYNGLMGPGLGEESVKEENSIFWGSKQERSYGKVQLFTRPFLTVPYLGKGSCDPMLESQLQQGEWIRGKKSISNHVELNMDLPDNYPLNSSNRVEELALGEWGRGGVDTRTTGDQYFRNK